MSKDQILTRTRAFLAENFLYMRPDFELGNDVSLLGSGIIDSMGVMEMIGFLEDEFGVQVDDHDVTETNIGTLDSIASYVVARQPADGRKAACGQLQPNGASGDANGYHVA